MKDLYYTLTMVSLSQSGVNERYSLQFTDIFVNIGSSERSVTVDLSQSGVNERHSLVHVCEKEREGERD